MNKAELVEQVAQKSELSRREAELAVDAALRTIEEQLASGTEINITGFGKFHVADRAARQGRNPQTGQPIQIKATRVPRFSAGAKLKQAVGR
jgi:DNA-binding protein HU-beta